MTKEKFKDKFKCFPWSAVLFALAIIFAVGFLVGNIQEVKNTPTIHCNCPEVECPKNSQEDTINNCIKILNDAETIKDLVEKGG